MHSYGRQGRAGFHKLRPRAGWSVSVQVEVKKSWSAVSRVAFRLAGQAPFFLGWASGGPIPSVRGCETGSKRPKYGPNQAQP
jgi:hypothetical protein